MSQCAFELWIAVFVSGLLELRRLDAGAGQEQIVRHSTERDAGRGRGHDEEGRTAKDIGQAPWCVPRWSAVRVPPRLPGPLRASVSMA